MLFFSSFCFHGIVVCVETGWLGDEGMEVAAIPGASDTLLGGLRADGHGLPEPGVLLPLLVVFLTVVVVVVFVDGSGGGIC